MNINNNVNLIVDAELDALIENMIRNQSKWDKQGNPERTLTFSFENTPNLRIFSHLMALTSTGKLKETVRRVLSQLAMQIGLEFVETEDAINSNLHFCLFNDQSAYDGFTVLSSKSSLDYVLIAIRDSAESDEIVVTHEIGHALGLAHPESRYEGIDYTLMLGQPISSSVLMTFSMADILALKKLYGPDTRHSKIASAFQLSLIPVAIKGTANADILYGLANNDFITGRSGDDTIFGRAGDDILMGCDGDDLLMGDDGDDNLWGGDGNDTLYGGKGHDNLFGGEGNDILLGGQRGDFLIGNDGNDLLMGEEGHDLMYGDKGDDNLWGGEGDDTLVGGEGSDTYLYCRDDGDDIIISDGNRDEDSDTLRLGENITRECMQLKRDNQDLVIEIIQTTGSIRVKNYYVQGSNTIKHILLSDRQAISYADIGLLIDAMARFKSDSPGDSGSIGFVREDRASLSADVTMPL